MDENFDNIRLGDNVVWRVDNLDPFKLFMQPYVKQAIADKRNLFEYVPNYEDLKDIVQVFDISDCVMT